VTVPVPPHREVSGAGEHRRRVLVLALGAAGLLVVVAAGIFGLVTLLSDGGDGADPTPAVAFRPVYTTVPAQYPEVEPTDRALAAIEACRCRGSCEAAIQPTTPSGDQPADACVLLEDPASPSGERLMLGPARLTESAVRTAEAVTDPDGGAGAVVVYFTERGATKFDALAAELFGLPAPRNRLAIIVDGAVVTAPTIDVERFEDLEASGLRISGDLSNRDAVRIAFEIRRAAG
jgi:preprotein translocase subunit SecD